MNIPMNALVSDMVNLLDERLREDFEERAGIIEFDAELSRDHAECLALLDVLHRHPSALCGVTVLRVALDGSDLWILVTNPALTHQQFGNVESGVFDLKDVINQQFNGFAILKAI
ncbi:hypothetical protein [Nitrosomonas ureae]|uniref:Uncharacterized protein n=1 Tax=Nitrosomonas ureae TaxID=44577 RepID=A0A1H9G7C3_9PROT|nr:hypothetical protein [Nitrosomonas ureae]SEQ45678.1 hypothetical protein SAMN05421510_105610 [Nitrosomonas ureae]